LALLCGFTAVFGLRPVQTFVGFEKEISSDIVGLVVASLTMACMVVGSLLFPGRASACEHKE
jgi:hypothetical protein